ncbi:sigma-54-dependent Fis family transcriptional regulator [Thermincola potens]|uniref:Putative PAS/PAC sensor protein n=1 Tax=Thermincola potens (strain JR) TaxID=635013 RepID=D5XBX2_THEPJ|nr:sigma-54-dependent Fis family transcriptional regulator [Thermincola potens]ADG81520.1 putative PAS/PAC sensor protein [Thermincola potens JR]
MRVLIKDVMSKGVVKLHKDWPVRKAAQIFLERVIDGAPVVDNENRVVGIFTKTHLMRALDKSLDMPVERLMNKNVIFISETLPVEEALNIPVGRLPVVDDDGNMVGWLTRTDLAFAFIDQYKKAIEGLSAILDSLYVGVLAVDRKGQISLVNKKAAGLLDIDPAKVLGISVDQVLPLPVNKAIVKNQSIIGLDLSGSGYPAVADITPVVSNGEVTGAVAVFR